MHEQDHGEWNYCGFTDTYYCTSCRTEVTKLELFHVWREDELYQVCLNRIALEKGQYCGR